MTCCTPGPTKAMLADAEQAFHKLMTGQSVVEITDQNGERVKFSSVNRDDLYQYIQRLRQQLCTDSGSGTGRPTGPAGFIF